MKGVGAQEGRHRRGAGWTGAGDLSKRPSNGFPLTYVRILRFLSVLADQAQRIFKHASARAEAYAGRYSRF